MNVRHDHVTVFVARPAVSTREFLQLRRSAGDYLGGTWQTVRLSRKAGNFSQWHCVQPPYKGLIEAWPRDLLGEGRRAC